MKPSVSGATCATIREMKKRSISIIGSPWAKGLEEKKWNTDENGRRIFVAFSVLHSNADCSPCDMCSGTRRERKKKRKRNEKEERNAVASPTRNRNASKCGGRGKIASTREELRADGHPRCPPALPTCVLSHRATNPLFRNLSSGIDVRHRAIWHDAKRGDSAASKRPAARRRLWYPKFARIRVMFPNYFDEILHGNTPPPINLRLIVICYTIKISISLLGRLAVI